MKKILTLLCAALPLCAFAQERERGTLDDFLKSPTHLAGIQDRAGGTHNKSNIGLFFENRGKLYPRRLSQGPSGEYPIGSGRHYVYRINPWVGVPNNVVQGRFTTNEEWEALGGYHNRALAQIAFSDNPATWPASGWPVKDAAGNPIFRSDQDSYCAYSDSNNTRNILGLEMHQTGYAYGVKFAADMIFFKFDLVNNGAKRLEDLYFAMYLDIDVGNISGGDPEWADEKIGFDKDLQLMYDYDADNYTSEWPGNIPGEMGIAFLRTPKVNGKELGVTDLHWFLYEDLVDVDSVQYGIMASTQSLYNSAERTRFFHPGANAPNIRFDDLSTQSPRGDDTDAVASSGPYSLEVGDTLTFITALVAGPNREQLFANTRIAKNIVELNFEVARPPDLPQLTAVPGNRRVTLYWDDRSERSRDKFSNEFDFEGYRLYRSLDKGATWDQIDRNAVPTAGPDPVPLVTFDRGNNGVGKDTGLQYSFVDTSVVNGFEYWYSLTAYDRGDANIESLESPRGSNLEVPNIAAVVPRQDAIGRVAPQAGNARQTGSGASNYQVLLNATDQTRVEGKTYTLEFAPHAVIQRGNLSSSVSATLVDANAATSASYVMRFDTSATFNLIEIATNDTVLRRQQYVSGSEIKFVGLSVILNDTPGVPLDFLPEKGDEVWIGRGVRAFAGGAQVMSLRAFEAGKPYATSDGLIFALMPPAQNPQPITYRDRFEFSTSTASVNAEAIKNELHRVRVVPNPYVVASRFEEEFGQLRREPLRVLKFTNLPPTCEINIFTIDGDLVKTLRHDNGTGVESWDMRSESGREIASGVYLYLVRTAGAEKLDRFAVIK